MVRACLPKPWHRQGCPFVVTTLSSLPTFTFEWVIGDDKAYLGLRRNS